MTCPCFGVEPVAVAEVHAQPRAYEQAVLRVYAEVPAVASSDPYTSRREGELSLRDNAEQVIGELSTEIAARVALAGVRIIESRLTRLSYAPEIAQAMLRQQQASAVVGARGRPTPLTARIAK